MTFAARSNSWLNPLVRMRRVLPSGLVTVVTACPAVYRGKARSPGLSRAKAAPAAAVGVSRIPDGAMGGRVSRGTDAAALPHGTSTGVSVTIRAGSKPLDHLREGMREPRSAARQWRQSLQVSRPAWYGERARNAPQSAQRTAV